MKIFLLVFAGSGFGGVCRYALGKVTHQIIPAEFPIGTLVVNVLASIIIGLLAGLFSAQVLRSEELKFLAVIGFCGGFSTFSAFSYDALRLLQTGNHVGFAAYTALSVLLCIFATWAGMQLFKA